MCFSLDMNGAIFHLLILTKSKLLKLKVQPNFNGSNTFKTMKICLGQRQFELTKKNLQYCYFCESSCLFYLSFNFDFYVSKIMYL